MKKRLLTIAFSISIALAFAGTVFAEDESSNITDCEGDYTEFALEVSELSDVAPEESLQERIEKKLLIVGDEDLDLTGLPGTYDAVASGDGLFVIQFETSADADAAYDILKDDPSVESIEFDSIMKAESITGKEGFAAASSGQGHLSWGAETTGVDEYSAYADPTAKATVAVVDTGVDYTHPFLSGRVISGKDFVDNDLDPDDEDWEGHGTHVAGTVADCTQGTNVDIMPIRVLDEEGEGETSWIVGGIYYACDNGADVINMSLGGNHSAYLERAITRALSKGSMVVASSGNEGVDIDRYKVCPAHIKDVITVGAVNKRSRVPWFSNYGKNLDLVAPGVDITSTVPGNAYESYDGTSMAAPHVSACIALMELRYGHISNSSIYALVKRACTPYSQVTYYGSGVIDLRNLIGSIAGQKVELVAKNYVYSGNVIRPKIKVSRNGGVLFEGSDYTLSYDSSQVGPAKAMVTGIGTYTGSKTISYTIVPKGTTKTSLKAKKRGFTLKWKRQAVETSGYQIQYGRKASMKGAKTITIKSNKATRKTIKGLKKKKKYTVRIRTYKNVNGKKYYSAWSRKYKVVVK